MMEGAWPGELLCRWSHDQNMSFINSVKVEASFAGQSTGASGDMKLLPKIATKKGKGGKKWERCLLHPFLSVVRYSPPPIQVIFSSAVRSRGQSHREHPLALNYSLIPHYHSSPHTPPLSFPSCSPPFVSDDGWKQVQG